MASFPALRRFWQNLAGQSPKPASPLSPAQIAAVQASWNKVIPIQDTAAMMLYTRLFELDPNAAKLFAGPITDQGRKLMAMIGSTVLGLDETAAVIPAIESLGRRHKLQYQVTAEDYDTVGQALLWMLEKALGPELSEEAQAAWVAVYGVLSQTMIHAAENSH